MRLLEAIIHQALLIISRSWRINLCFPNWESSSPLFKSNEERYCWITEAGQLRISMLSITQLLIPLNNEKCSVALAPGFPLNTLYLDITLWFAQPPHFTKLKKEHKRFVWISNLKLQHSTTLRNKIPVAVAVYVFWTKDYFVHTQCWLLLFHY